MMNNTAVSGLEFSTTPTAGGSPFSITLATTAAGNLTIAIDWGDGTADNTSDSTPSHAYNRINGGQLVSQWQVLTPLVLVLEVHS